MTRTALKEATFWEHTAELLSRARTVAYALIVSSLAAMLIPIDPASVRLSFTDPMYQTPTLFLINKIRDDLLPLEVELLPMDWFSPLSVYIFGSFFLGALVSLPVIGYEIYKFINPSLYAHERRYIALFTIPLTVLFIFGVIFGYVLILPNTFRMLIASTRLVGLSPRYEFTSFYSIVLGGLGVTGLIFTFPVFFLALIRMGIIKTGQFSKSRRYIYGGLLVVIAVLTPDPTLVSDILIFVPIIILFELSLLIGKRIEKKTQTTEQRPTRFSFRKP